MAGETRKDNDDNGGGSWQKLALQLMPGERRPDRTVNVRSNSAILYACRMSSSFGLFTLSTINTEGDGDEDNERLDVVLKKDDGWSAAEISTVMELVLKDDASNIWVEGYLERVRPKSVQDTSPVCLHAQMVRIAGSCDNKEALEWKIVAGTTTKTTIQETAEDVQESVAAGHGQNLPQNSDSSNAGSSSGGGWRGAKDDTRFSKFVAFLLETFGGYERLSSQPVMDIAGGAGGLAFELSVRHAIDCIVVDTKPLRFKAKQVRHVKFRKECVKRLLARPNDIGKSPLAQNLLRRFQVDSDLETLQANQLQTLLDSNQVLGTGERMRKNDKQNDADKRLRTILLDRQCSVLCGMHPDQATDHIIDIGLALNIPWAVVPCCVFPQLFQVRRTSTGKTVRTYEDYCDYIRSKNAAIQEVDLSFRGRNKVFYWIPPGCK